jgi:hypothetical protein
MEEEEEEEEEEEQATKKQQEEEAALPPAASQEEAAPPAAATTPPRRRHRRHRAGRRHHHHAAGGAAAFAYPPAASQASLPPSVHRSGGGLHALMAGDVGGWPPELAHDAFVAGGGIAGPAERLLRLYWRAFGGGPPASEQEEEEEYEECEDEDEEEDEEAEAAAAAARQAALERALAAAALDDDEEEEEEEEARRVGAFLEQLRLLSGPWAGVVYDESTGRVLAARGPEEQQPLYWGVAPAPSGGRVLLFGTDPSDLSACSPPAEPFPAGALYHWRGARGVPAAAAAATVGSPPPPRRRPEMARPGQSQPGESGFVLSPSRRGARPLPLPDEAFGALRPLAAGAAPSDGGATTVVRSEPVLDPETGAVVGCVFRVVTRSGGEGDEEEGGLRAPPFDPRKLRPLAVGGDNGDEEEEDLFATPLPGSPAAEAAKRRESKNQRRRHQRARAEAKARREREREQAAKATAAAEALPAA